MDSALRLRLAFEQNILLEDMAIKEHLESSALVKKLTADHMEHPLFAVFRIIGISEIPYMERLQYTQRLIEYIVRRVESR
jgi:hypothetical protein